MKYWDITAPVIAAVWRSVLEGRLVYWTVTLYIVVQAEDNVAKQEDDDLEALLAALDEDDEFIRMYRDKRLEELKKAFESLYVCLHCTVTLCLFRLLVISTILSVLDLW